MPSCLCENLTLPWHVETSLAGQPPGQGQGQSLGVDTSVSSGRHWPLGRWRCQRTPCDSPGAPPHPGSLPYKPNRLHITPCIIYYLYKIYLNISGMKKVAPLHWDILYIHPSIHPSVHPSMHTCTHAHICIHARTHALISPVLRSPSVWRARRSGTTRPGLPIARQRAPRTPVASQGWAAPPGHPGIWWSHPTRAPGKTSTWREGRYKQDHAGLSTWYQINSPWWSLVKVFGINRYHSHLGFIEMTELQLNLRLIITRHTQYVIR